MPWMKIVNGKSVRDYDKENKLYNSKPEQRARRSQRTILRNKAIKAGIVHRGDHLDLDHKTPLSKGGANTLANARVASQGDNRSFSRNSDSSLKSQVSKREKHWRKK
jgi:5-methylcytosine-specific restriction endonuclease McrA